MPEWIKAAEAADILGISKRRVLEYAQAGALKSRKVRDTETNQMSIQVHAGDVERLREEREHPTPQPSQTLPEVRGATKPQALALPALLEALSERNRQNWPVPRYLTEDQAVSYLGWGKGAIRARLKPEPLGPRGALVYRREDLDKL